MGPSGTAPGIVKRWSSRWRGDQRSHNIGRGWVNGGLSCSTNGSKDIVKLRGGDTVRVVNCWKANEVGEIIAAAAWNTSDGTADHPSLGR
jgi:hypothetical protein